MPAIHCLASHIEHIDANEPGVFMNFPLFQIQWGWAVSGLTVPHAISTDPQHWHTRAADARVMAAKITDAKAKLAMLDMARNYEQIAKRVQQGQQDENETAN